MIMGATASDAVAPRLLVYKKQGTEIFGARKINYLIIDFYYRLFNDVKLQVLVYELLSGSVRTNLVACIGLECCIDVL